MKNNSIPFLLVNTCLFFVFTITYAHATKENRPVCNIEGVIKTVNVKDSIYKLGVTIDSTSISNSSTGSKIGFYSCKSFYKIGEVREIFVIDNDIKAGDTFSVGQKIKGEINDVGYRAGSLEGMRLNKNYTLVTTSSQDSQQDVKEEKPSTTNSCAVISQNLRYLSRDTNGSSDVSILQDFLNSKGYLKSQPTGFFGVATRKAVIAFQNDNGLRATPPGFVGAGTRAKIQAIDCGNNTTVNTTTNNSPLPSVNIQNPPASTISVTTDPMTISSITIDTKQGKVIVHGDNLDLAEFLNYQPVGIESSDSNSGQLNKIILQTKTEVVFSEDVYLSSKPLDSDYQFNALFTAKGGANSSNVYIYKIQTTDLFSIISPKRGVVYPYGRSIPFSWKRNIAKDMIDPTVYLDNVHGGRVNAYGHFLPDIYGAALPNVNTLDIQSGAIPSNIVLPITGGQVMLVLCEYPRNTNNNSYPKTAPSCTYGEPFTISSLDTSSESAPTVSLAANPKSITVGQATTLTTLSTNSRICTGNGTDGTKFYGTGAVYPTKTTIYTFYCWQSSDQTGKMASASVTVNVSSAPTSATSPYINVVTMESDNMDGISYMHVSGDGFTTTSLVHVKGDGFDGFLSPVSNYPSGNGSNGKNITVALPKNVDINKIYNVYVSDSNVISNTVSTTKPFQG